MAREWRSKLVEDMLARDSSLTDAQKMEARERQRETLRRIAEGEHVPGVQPQVLLEEFFECEEVVA